MLYRPRMALRFWAYVFISPGFDPGKNVTELASATCRFKTVGIDVSKKEQVVEVAKKLVSEGVQLIELCGGFGPVWVAKVIEATGGKVPVGSVAYGPEARKPLLEILS